jgi:hypothetical protein
LYLKISLRWIEVTKAVFLSDLAVLRQTRQSVYATPPQIAAMKKVQDFVAGLARNRKSTAEIKKIIRAVYGDKAWRMASIYFVIMMVKAGETNDNQRHLHAKENQENCRHCCRCCCQTGASPARISHVTMGGSNMTKCNIL